MTRETITYAIDDPHRVSDQECRQVLQQLLNHLNLDVVRVERGEGRWTSTHIELEKSE